MEQSHASQASSLSSRAIDISKIPSIHLQEYLEEHARRITQHSNAFQSPQSHPRIFTVAQTLKDPYILSHIKPDYGSLGEFMTDFNFSKDLLTQKNRRKNDSLEQDIEQKKLRMMLQKKSKNQLNNIYLRNDSSQIQKNIASKLLIEAMFKQQFGTTISKFQSQNLNKQVQKNRPQISLDRIDEIFQGIGNNSNIEQCRDRKMKNVSNHSSLNPNHTQQKNLQANQYPTKVNIGNSRPNNQSRSSNLSQRNNNSSGAIAMNKSNYSQFASLSQSSSNNLSDDITMTQNKNQGRQKYDNLISSSQKMQILQMVKAKFPTLRRLLFKTECRQYKKMQELHKLINCKPVAQNPQLNLNVNKGNKNLNNKVHLYHAQDQQQRQAQKYAQYGQIFHKLKNKFEKNTEASSGLNRQFSSLSRNYSLGKIKQNIKGSVPIHFTPISEQQFVFQVSNFSINIKNAILKPDLILFLMTQCEIGSLEQIKLYNCKITQQCLLFLVEVLYQIGCQNLKVLQLQSINFQQTSNESHNVVKKQKQKPKNQKQKKQKFCHSIKEILQNNSQLERIVLNNLQITSKQFCIICLGVAANDTLQQLVLRGNLIDQASIKSLEMIAKHCKNLYKIDLQKNFLQIHQAKRFSGENKAKIVL